MQNPVMQVNLTTDQYLELMKCKAQLQSGDTWATSSDWKDRLLNFAQSIIIDSRVFITIDVLNPLLDTKPVDLSKPKNGPRRSTVKETVEDYV